MRRFLLITLALLVVVPLFAQDIKLSGPHYNLNIIGVDKAKNSDMTGGDRHTIFVALGRSGTAVTNIYLKPGYDFKVCDGNGFDQAYDCNGAPIKSYTGAAFQLPCNTALTYDPTYGCPSDVAQRSYYVYARALAKPNGTATMYTCAYEKGDEDGDGIANELVCSISDNWLTLTRGTGKSLWQDATDELTSIEADVDGDGVIEKVALFASQFEDYFWYYGNNGLRLAQIRFYPASQ